MIIPRSLLGGLSVERADLYGKPHIGAWSKGLRYGRSQGWCPVCGAPATNCHHIAGRGGLTITVAGKPVRLLEGMRPHDPRLYAYGFWAIEDKDRHVVREVRS